MYKLLIVTERRDQMFNAMTSAIAEYSSQDLAERAVRSLESQSDLAIEQHLGIVVFRLYA